MSDERELRAALEEAQANLSKSRDALAETQRELAQKAEELASARVELAKSRAEAQASEDLANSLQRAERELEEVRALQQSSARRELRPKVWTPPQTPAVSARKSTGPGTPGWAPDTEPSGCGVWVILGAVIILALVPTAPAVAAVLLVVGLGIGLAQSKLGAASRARRIELERTAEKIRKS